jgi:endoglucanase
LKARRDFRLPPAWLATLDGAVKNALASGLMVILDLHNYNDVAEDPAAFKPRLLAYCTQVAEHFKDAPEGLLFEILNEPNGKLDGPLWNAWLAEALAVIRATNPARTVVIGPPSWNGIDHRRRREAGPGPIGNSIRISSSTTSTGTAGSSLSSGPSFLDPERIFI